MKRACDPTFQTAVVDFGGTAAGASVPPICAAGVFAPRRDARNLGLAAIGALSLRLAERPVTDRLTALVERRHWGLLQQASLPLWLETAAAVVLMDYTLYVWHVLTHKAPWLWRFHAVHHVDLDLDASTAIRFHFGEHGAPRK